MSIDERIEAFAYLVRFLVTFAMSAQVTKGMKELQRLKARLEGATRLGREFCLMKLEATLAFIRMLAQVFFEDFAE